MGKFQNFEIYLFVLLSALSIIGIGYYLYKAAYRFDPYYNFKIENSQRGE